MHFRLVRPVLNLDFSICCLNYNFQPLEAQSRASEAYFLCLNIVWKAKHILNRLFRIRLTAQWTNKYLCCYNFKLSDVLIGNLSLQLRFKSGLGLYLPFFTKSSSRWPPGQGQRADHFDHWDPPSKWRSEERAELFGRISSPECHRTVRMVARRGRPVPDIWLHDERVATGSASVFGEWVVVEVVG